MSKSLLIVGASARAAAGSAIRAGFAPWCIDRFADRDLKRMATVQRCPAGRYPQGIAALAERAPADASLLLAGAMENHLPVVRQLAERFKLLGSDADAMELARDPVTLASQRPMGKLHPCAVHVGADWSSRVAWWLAVRTTPGRYMSKPRRSAGGTGIRVARQGEAVDPARYLQRRAIGLPISAVCFADGWSARVLGVTRQLVGEDGFGARPYQYCGSVFPQVIDESARRDLAQLAAALAQRCDLRGLFGIDLMLQHNGVLRPLEINPRYTASVEVLERAGNAALLASAPRPVEDGRATGKAIVFARRDGVVPDVEELLGRDVVADVPEPGQPVRTHEPICTLLAQGDSAGEVIERLNDMAHRLYTRLHA